MEAILETERLILKELLPSDAQNLYDLNADEEVIRYTGDPPFDSVSAAREFLENYQDYQKNGFGRWAVITKANNQFVGWCGLKLHAEGFVDLGFRFFKKDWNMGYATESSQACLAYAFGKLGLKEVIGRAAAENKASIRVLEKLNMQFWKHDLCKGIENSKYYRVFNE